MCFGCPSGWKCCGKAFGHCICKRPRWDSCCKRVKDPVCVTANAGCATLKKPLDLILQGAIKVVDKSRHGLDVAKGILSAAQGAVDAAKAPLDLAIKALDVVKATYKAGVSALSALANLAPTKIIAISEMYFNVELSVANGGKFQCRIKGVLMGKSFDEQLYFDTKNVFSIAKSLGEKAISGISKYIG